ncbi:MAG: cation:proton antiporter [Oscillospiraceae bacterium]|nr:cation:proton antiporter [Oscillospiraceae bacterium]
MNILLSLSFGMIIALLMTRIMKKISLPNVTGYLIAGLIAGPYCLKLFNSGNLDALTIITNVALGFIAFSIGGEFKLSALKQLGAKIFIITVFEAVGASFLVAVTFILFKFPLTLALVLGAIASATAPAATLMVVRQYKAHGPVTSTLLPVVAIDDAVCLMLFSILSSIAKSLESEGGFSLYQTILKPIIEIVLSLVIGFAVGVILSVGTKFFKSRANRISLVCTAVFLGVGISEKFGLSSLLLCMAIGAALANYSHVAEKVMDGSEHWTPPLFMLFFVISGAQFNFSILKQIGAVGVIYILMRSFGKYFGARLGCRIAGTEKTVRNYLGITLLPQAGVAIGMAQLSLTVVPEYGEQIRAVVLCATLVYELVGPLLTKLSLQKAGEIQKAA